MHRAPCAKSKWKSWPKDGNGPANGWKKSYSRKLTATAEFFPLSGRKARHRRKKPMQLRTVVGVVKLSVWQGQDGRDGPWGVPIREQWRLTAHQQMSPALEEKLAFTATLAGSYEQASQIADRWGSPVDDSVIHQVVQRLGQRAEEQTQARLEQVPQEKQPRRAPAELAILMADGWMARFRGPGWGKKKTKKERVAWHEIKTGVFFPLEQWAQSQSGRGQISDKVIIRWKGDPLEFGRRLGWEALRGGLGRAKETLVLGDGGKWIWKMAEDRWPKARKLLDFFHGSEHVNLLAAAICREERSAKIWSEKRLHELRHGKEDVALRIIAGLKESRGAAKEEVRKQKNYFAHQSGRMNYQEIADRGWPIGSGPVESACRQSQCRFKRSGQFWTDSGFTCLSALDEARRNGHWDQIWMTE
jgi:hypothetical protein